MDSLNPYNPFEGKKKGATYNQEQLDFIKQKLDEGWSVAKLHSEYGLSKDCIKRRIKNNDWICSKTKRENKLTNKELMYLRQMLDDGYDDKEISKKLNISIEAVSRRRLNGVHLRPKKKNKYSFNENYFDNIDDEHKAYWVGFLMADGYILTRRNRGHGNESQSFGFCISSKDYELFEYFKKDLKANNPVNIYKNRTSFNTKYPTGRILLTSQHTINSLKKVGIVENKTFITSMPPIEEKLIPHFIRGYSDGDGSIVIDKNGRVQWSFCGTKELLNQIQEFFFGYDYYKLSQRWPERHNNNWQLKITGWKNVPRCLDICYKDATVFLKRKYNKYVEIQGRK